MRRPLSFSDVDGLGFAARRGRLPHYEAVLDLTAHDLGPFMEYLLLAAAGIVPRPGEARWLSLGELTDLYRSLRARHARWLCPRTRQMGVFRTEAHVPEDDSPWVGFCLAAQKAAVAVGFPKQTAAQLVAALGELQSNIYEHSGAPMTGIVVFRGRPGCFEFVIADWGVGVLASLRRCEAYATITDHREALQLALTNGVSRFGPSSGRGYGFRDLFTGLANLNSSLRFRSGNAALTIEGCNPGSIPWTREEKILMRGFFVSVACVI